MLVYDRFTTPIGQLTLVKSEGGICYIGLPSTTMDQVESWTRQHFPGATLQSAPLPFELERKELVEYLRGQRSEFTFPVDHRNSPFSKEVLDVVRRVPYGKTSTYGKIAHELGRPKAARAVGRAIGANPLPLVIPCHRIVGHDGSLTGFGGGLPLKQQLLHMEAG